ncbi:hypothetical protein C7446_2696 [Kushneria sinocarnis]|uniref:Aminoglycoside phosphotransferase domain-containing protein n=1 Tax=Kushneria sinocarnis TaxID=595502 RepID=A0A420WTW7_9GAMM|nr:hypothetical protein [Kushneria sinocarnis]RKQ96836.1 hypothetical protein C7446_2696 [Kushneria sinocarnis]
MIRSLLQGKSRFGMTRVVRRLSARRQQKGQDVSLLSVNGLYTKYLTFDDSSIAADIERRLRAFESSELFPTVIFRHESALWLEYVEGETLQRPDHALVDRLLDIYVELYDHDPERMPPRETPFPRQLQQDLKFLHQVGLLDGRLHGELTEAAERLMPGQLWLGYDYTDPGFKNFVQRPDGRVCAIDAESLQSGQLLGTGLMKARWRWPEPFWDLFHRRLLERLDLPAFEAGLPFIELCTLARWTKKKILVDQGHSVDVKAFERFLYSEEVVRNRTDMSRPLGSPLDEQSSVFAGSD